MYETVNSSSALASILLPRTRRASTRFKVISIHSCHDSHLTLFLSLEAYFLSFMIPVLSERQPTTAHEIQCQWDHGVHPLAHQQETKAVKT